MEKNSIEKKLTESIETILGSRTDACTQSGYKTETNKNGDLVIKYKHKCYKDYTLSDKFGFIFLFCIVLVPLVTFFTTHLYYLSPLIILGIIVLLYFPFTNVENKCKKDFLQKILVPFMIISCLTTASYSWNRMNNFYENNADMKKEQIEKVNKNIPKWFYLIDFKKDKKSKITSQSNDFENSFKNVYLSSLTK